MRQKMVFDIETYSNYFLIAFKNIETDKIFSIEASNGAYLTQKDIGGLKHLLSIRTIIGFNSRNFDIPLLLYAIKGATTEQLNFMANEIINGAKPKDLMQQYNLDMLDYIDHIDLQQPAPSVKASLKLYGARLHSKKLQELPIKPDTTLSAAQMCEIYEYCLNDLQVTYDLYQAISKDIDLHDKMCHLANEDLRSKSGAQVAESVIINQLKAKKSYNISDNLYIKYNPPAFISFQTTKLQTLFDNICNETFKVVDGKIALPQWLADTKININNTNYQIGIGGLHSCEKSKYVQSSSRYKLIDADVTSYYPSIILQLQLYPKHIGSAFLQYYKTIFDDRVAAKKSGDTLLANSYKLILNSSYGKFGDKYSQLFSPDLLLQVTLTGQLALLMLIEMLELENIEVVSANTDGIVSYVGNDKLYYDICKQWQGLTCFNLEFNEYEALYSRDVNSYIAIKKNGFKSKGFFALNQLSKNPHADICITATINYLSHGANIEDTIKNCQDIRQFLIVRTVNGGGQWKGQYLGKVVRFYWAKNGAPIAYKVNNNKVPKSEGSYPAMALPDVIPNNIDYHRYIKETEKILQTLGVINNAQEVLI